MLMISSREARALLATNWWRYINASSDHCTWREIRCMEGSVISIDFYCYANEGLGDLGSLDFASFPNLEELYFPNCKLEGSILEQIGLPVSFTNLTRLKYVYLSNNNLTGKIPLSFANLTSLENLDLSNNNFIGQIPPALVTNLPFLETLDLSNNNLHGPILSRANLQVPFSFFSYLNLFRNNFNVISPSQLVRLRILVTLDKRVVELGVVALETIGGKHPGELLSYLNSSTNHGTMLENILDQHLSYPTDKLIEKEILRVCQVALSCILTDPKARPTMKEVSQELSR